MTKNSSLLAAKTAKNDEFYTQLTDIEKELSHYRNHFKGKTIFCNCDDPTSSNFWRYFHLNFAFLGLRKLIATHYDPVQPTYKLEYEGGDDRNIEVGVRTRLSQNGDFRSPECIGLLKESDIVVTNPPFSMFRDYVMQLMEYEKKFVIIGNKNAVTYKEIFPLIEKDRMWIGVRSMNSDFWLRVPNGQKYEKIVDGVPLKHIMACWFTNLDHQKRHNAPVLFRTYTSDDYPMYDNYDAINVDKVDDIPCDYDGIMGVPITFLDKYCPEQFEIIGMTKTPIGNHLRTKVYGRQIQHGSNTQSTVTKLNDGAAILSKSRPAKFPFYEIDGIYYIAVYPRILIRRR